MKKALLIFLAPLYLLFTNGLVLEAHYCMGRLAGTEIGLVHNQEDNCNQCGMDVSDDANNHCCKDDVKVLKLGDNLKPSLFTYDLQLPVADLPVLAFHSYQPVWEDVKSVRLSSHSPPDLVYPPLYLQYGVFRI